MQVGPKRAKWEQYHAVAKRRDEIMKRLQREPVKGRSEFTRLLGQRMQAELKPEELNLIVEEEEVAWQLGRDTLVVFGFEDLKSYGVATKHGVHKHKVKLGIDAVESDDESVELDDE
jgi:hypothetical protein